MSTQALGLAMDVGPSVLPNPHPVLQRTSPPTDIEMKPSNHGAGRKEPPSTPGSITQTPMASKTPNELEMSRPSSPQHGSSVDIIQTIWNPYMNRFRLTAVCVISLGLGLNDLSSGALLAYIEKQAIHQLEQGGQVTDVCNSRPSALLHLFVALVVLWHPFGWNARSTIRNLRLAFHLYWPVCGHGGLLVAVAQDRKAVGIDVFLVVSFSIVWCVIVKDKRTLDS
jgi:hypothetical protein